MASRHTVDWRGRVAGFFAVAGLILAAVNAIGALGSAFPLRAPDTTRAVTYRAVLDSGDDWLAKIKSEKFWADKRASAKSSSAPTSTQQTSAAKASRSPNLTAAANAAVKLSNGDDRSQLDQTFVSGAAWYHGDGDTFKTVCVRLCDGFQFPVSFSTTEDQFEADAAKCQQSCTSPARLFVIKTPPGADDELRDLNGLPYKRLKTADLFRTTFVEDCKCRPHPWEQQAIDRHRMYAADAKRRTGDAIAAAEFERLKASLDKTMEAERQLLALANEKVGAFAIAGAKDTSVRKAGKSANGKASRDASRRTAHKPAANDDKSGTNGRPYDAATPPPRRAVGSGPPTVMRLGGAVTTAAPSPPPVVAPRPKTVRAGAERDEWRRGILSGGSSR